MSKKKVDKKRWLKKKSFSSYRTRNVRSQRISPWLSLFIVKGVTGNGVCTLCSLPLLQPLYHVAIRIHFEQVPFSDANLRMLNHVGSLKYIFYNHGSLQGPWSCCKKKKVELCCVSAAASCYSLKSYLSPGLISPAHSFRPYWRNNILPLPFFSPLAEMCSLYV